MKRERILWCRLAIVGVILSVGLGACTEKQNVLTPEETAAGWTLLFDGKTLNGWRDYNGKGQTAPWVVEKGTLASLGQGTDSTGYIVTDKQYENFELVFDWKISQGGNSGLLYHVLERPQFSTPYMSGPEYQLLDNEGFAQKIEDWQKAGADYAMHSPDPAKTILKPAGQWNQSKIVFDNGHVEHWLNGEKIVEFEAWSDDWFIRKNSGKWDAYPEYGLARRGVFSLQDHGYRAWFRNMKIRELPRKTSGQEVSLFNGKDLTGWEVYGTELWYVKDSLLYCESGPDKQYGYLGTRDYYNDFDLTVDFKQFANGNSGVFFRSWILHDVSITGWQCEVAPPNLFTAGIYESVPKGRQWLIKPEPEKEKILKMGDWNTMRLVVKGDHVTTYLNGTQMIELTDAKIGSEQGRIMLQIHSGGGIKVAWKNLKVKRL